MNVYYLYGRTKEDLKKKEQTIYVRLSYGRSKIHYRASTKLIIKKDGWNFKKGEAAGVVNLMTGSRSVEDSQYFQEVKDKLDQIRKHLKNEFRQLKLKTEHNFYTKQDWNIWAKEQFEIATGLKEARTNIAPLFTKKFKDYIDLNKLTWATGTLRGYNSHKTLFNEFMAYKKHEYKTTEIDLNFYKELQEWSYEEKEHLPNTFGNHIKKVKAVMNYFISEEIGFQHHPNIKSKRFQKISKSVPHEVLTSKEIELVFNFESHKDSLNNVRDITKLLYWGCLRYGEFYEAIQQEPLRLEEGKKTKWQVYVSKTEELKTIPLHEDALKLIREDKLPRLIERENYVKYLKEILLECGIKKTKIGAHTIRRSFCTNMYNEEHSPKYIMMYSGHKTERMLMEYIQQKNMDLDSTIPTK